VSTPHEDPSDLYARLGLAADASKAEINRSYRRLARALHPDGSVGQDGDTERFQEVLEAHAILSDPDRRRAYDRTRRALADRDVTTPCPVCRGRRVINRPCELCRGTGRVLTNATWLREALPCTACHGRGARRAVCGACSGTGTTTTAPGSGSQHGTR
jgi:DnaJ-class molecular chaperone